MKENTKRTPQVLFSKLTKFEFFKPFFDEKTGEPIKKNIIGAILFLTFLTALIFFFEQKRKQQVADRQRSPCYTIGYSYKLKSTIKRSELYYKYEINHKEYEDFTYTNLNKSDFVKNRAYLVQFKKGDPTNNEIFLDCRVPDSIQQYPSAGWDSLPDWAHRCP